MKSIVQYIVTFIVIGLAIFNYEYNGFEASMFFIMIMIYVQLRLDSHPNNSKFNK